MKTPTLHLSPVIRGGLNIYINGKLVASRHNNVTASFILSLVKAIIGVSSTYGGYFEMPSTATVKLSYQNTPVTSAVLSHVSFTEETIAGYEHTRIIYSFSDASRTKYSFDSLQLWTASTHSLLAHVSDATLNKPLRKNPQDVVQIDWWVEMESGQPFANMLSYLQQEQVTNCSSSCNIPSAINYTIPNMSYGYSVFNTYFAMLALPNIISVARNIKTPLTNFLVNILTTATDVKPEGIVDVICLDICSCQSSSSQIPGFVSEFVGDNYIYVAFNFNNPCPSGQYVIPITKLSLGRPPEAPNIRPYPILFAVAPVPSTGTGASALLIKIPYGKLTLKNLFTHQGE